MSCFVTIQKLAETVGIDPSYIRTMISNDDIKAYKMDGYKRVYVDLEEFNSIIKPINTVDEKINLEKYLV
jgi:hypothetical protein